LRSEVSSYGLEISAGGLASGLRTQRKEVHEMSETAVEIGHHYRVTGDHSGKIIKVFNVVEETLLVGAMAFT